MRADGYYHVKWHTDEWIIAELQSGIWFVCGMSLDFEDSDFAEIDETPIDREKRFGIKPPEWHCMGGENYVMDTPFGMYYASLQFGVWRTDSQRMVSASHSTLDESKTACESHYREQVLKCLTT